MNKWLTVSECRELAEQLCIPDTDKEHKNSSKPMTWNKLQDYLPALGYEVQKKRKMLNGKQQQAYFITGEWHDMEVEDTNFLQLVEAKMANK